MSAFFQNGKERIRQLRPIPFVLFFSLANLLWGFLFALVVRTFSSRRVTENGPEFSSFWEEIFMVVFLAPILETLFFQQLTHDLLKKKNPSLQIVVSALAFSVTHFYNIFYVIATFFSGALLMGAFLLARPHKNPFLATTMIHAAYNGFVVLLRHT